MHDDNISENKKRAEKARSLPAPLAAYVNTGAQSYEGARKDLAWLVCAMRTLKWREIQCAFSTDSDAGIIDSSQRLVMQPKEIHVCGSLVDGEQLSDDHHEVRCREKSATLLNGPPRTRTRLLARRPHNLTGNPVNRRPNRQTYKQRPSTGFANGSLSPIGTEQLV
jgi:hypothetical protein